ncbi:MAG: DUF1211 domain-containing protein [Planctomycetes bacterium]|nr:DUF1211 domain-containing protein [Planctomycetota bacterium]
MHKGRLEAFSDGVLAIVITIMVLEMKVPHGDGAHGAEFADLHRLWPVFSSYVLSFVYLGIYWNNHHHLLQAVTRIGGGVLWANLHLLFWLSLLPFATGWMGENHFAAATVVLYGGVLLGAALAYHVLVRALLAHHAADSPLAQAIGADRKGKLSLVLYLVGIALASWQPWLAVGVYTAVALIWLVPDRRIERTLAH